MHHTFIHLFIYLFIYHSFIPSLLQELTILPSLRQVVPESGRGWQLFRVGAGGVGGLLWARQPLDYENPAHRAGFRFRVEVTDRVSGWMGVWAWVKGRGRGLMGGCGKKREWKRK